jgi:hypothetical protein
MQWAVVYVDPLEYKKQTLASGGAKARAFTLGNNN